MASDVTIDISRPMFDVNDKVREAIDIFTSIEASCTRFNPESPLMRANADPHDWHSFPSIAIDVIKAAYEAYRLTKGVFDPRVLVDLLMSGYDENRRFDSIGAVGNDPGTDRQSLNDAAIRELSEWHPEFRDNEIRLGDLPIDLGGIGKGFAVQRTMEILQDCAEGVLINAGGDIAAEGNNENDQSWRLGIENPWNPEGDPVLVVELADISIATSSIRLRSWFKDGQLRHHLINPLTGAPGGQGLVAVSVIAPSTDVAEVWSKTLFLQGISDIERFADEHVIAASWIDEEGNIFVNDPFQSHTIWGLTKAPLKN
jgi:thiamine biosynthesis lipoprotein